MGQREAADWLSRYGRDIDRACAAAEAGGSATGVRAALSTFQNSDGGFGKALEPDVRTPRSSVLATTVALQMLTEYDAGDSPCLERALAFLVAQYEPTSASWEALPRSASTSPRAPWWNYQPPSECLVNPRAEILGYLYRWGVEPVSGKAVDLGRIEEELISFMTGHETIEMHELMVLNRLFRTPELSPRLAASTERFLDLARAAIPTERADWGGYGLTPLVIIDHPDHTLAPEFRRAVVANLEMVRDQQVEDGSWDPPWDWGAQLEAEWHTAAERDVRSLITCRNYCLLERFDALAS